MLLHSYIRLGLSIHASLVLLATCGVLFIEHEANQNHQLFERVIKHLNQTQWQVELNQQEHSVTNKALQEQLQEQRLVARQLKEMEENLTAVVTSQQANKGTTHHATRDVSQHATQDTFSH